jgi:hypothetical protein
MARQYKARFILKKINYENNGVNKILFPPSPDLAWRGNMRRGKAWQGEARFIFKN